ncbi:hypothetical protein GQ44DRAFT_727405 [Phaeosphaeriaceae sp. PMI808]|nr:hypothetical protein GQ44DRAFT_727405 [Phaeosphaeriaceae sp. PMI808]
MAGVAWLLPITAIVTPATMNVVTGENVLRLQGDPPQLYFDPNTYANLQTLVRSNYIGPSPDTLRTVFSSAMTGRILGIAQGHPNMTYTLQFLGPALRCDYADATLISNVYASYKRYLTGIENQYRYIAWVPSNNGRGNLSFATGENIASLDLESTDTAHIFFIPNTTSAGPNFVGGIQLGSNNDHYGYQDLLDCKLHNASYRAFFNLTFPTQAINVESRELLNPVNVSLDISKWQRPAGSPDAVAHQAQRICYQSIMDSFGRLLAGYEWWRDGYVVTQKTSWNMMAINWTTRDGTQKGLESLFQNITLSMLATSSLIMNTTVAANNAVPVNILTSVNVYSYNPKDLWLAYGIACGAALLSTILGIYGIWSNGGVGYQGIFSTFIRTTRNQVLGDLIDPNDHGTEPIPKKLAEASIIIDTYKQ